MSICGVELDPSDWYGDQPIVETLHRYLQCDVEVYTVQLRRILSVLRSKSKMSRAERQEMLHRNANLVVGCGSMNVSYLDHEEAGDAVEHIVGIVEQYLLVPLRINIPLNHE